ncbi:hypothetical protein ACFWFV_05375 [Streptomyces diastaticus]|uniref:Uncharacterized protein n=1 Tax=Streptomyces griseus TaxID=1911 RepID=A0A380ML17_STRGR|nr:hypothetical protein [Streptomyces griseus]SUO93335.1 Uncharacterised protein [Streptomyces griseus]
MNSGVREYHWVLTLQYSNGRQLATREGLLSASPGLTRQQAYLAVSQQVCAALGISDQACVITHFSLAPNQL